MHPARRGSFLILSQSLIWGMFPVLTVLLGKTVGPAVALYVSALIAAAFMGALLPWRGGLRGLWNGETQRYIFIASLLIGGIYYGLWFFGLQHTSPGNAALFGLMEIPYNALLAHWWWKESLTKRQIGGTLLMVSGALLILIWNVHSFHLGDFVILFAAIFPVYGNWCMQRARERATTEAIMFVRSLWTALFAFILALSVGESFSLATIIPSWPFLLLNGAIVLAFSKILWLEGIRFISVTEALSLNTTAVLWTLVFSFLILGVSPTWFQLLAIIPMFFGVRMLTKNVHVSEQQVQS